MIEIEIGEDIITKDPHFDNRSADTRPAPALPTNDPNRYTIYVPTDNATLSMGEACDAEQRINDRGITGRTDTHIHFQVTDTAPTIVSLGGPVWSGTQDLPDYRHDCNVPVASRGYSMVTAENAWHDAVGQHYLVSQTKDIVVRTTGAAAKGTALLQSDHGCTTIGAGTNVTVGARGGIKMLADTELPLELEGASAYDHPVERKVDKEFRHKEEEAWVFWLDKVQTIYSLIGGVIKLNGKLPCWKKPAWAIGSWVDVASLIADGAKLYLDISGRFDPSKKGVVDIIAENDIRQFASGVAIFGKMGVNIASAVTVDVVGLTAGMKAGTFAGVWAGLQSSLKAGKDVAVDAEWGETVVRARKDVSVSSSAAGVKIQGEEDVQLSAVSGSAYMHAAKMVYVGAGGGPGYGLKSEGKGLHLGKFSAPKTFSSPGHVRDEGFSVDEKVLGARFHGSQFQMKISNEIRLKSQKIKLNADGNNVTIKGSKVLIG